MRIAIATDRDDVASDFECCPMCTVAEVDHGRIQHTLVIPNPGCNPAFWADLFVRNSITHVIAGTMGPTAKAVLGGRGITVILGECGDISDVVERLARGELLEKRPDRRRAQICCGSTT